MYNVFSSKSFKIAKFSIGNLLFLFMLVFSVMGFHAWVVYITLAVLDDVSSIIILKRGVLTEPLPAKTIYVYREGNSQVRRTDCIIKNCIFVDDKYHSRDDAYSAIDAVMYDQTSLQSQTKPRQYLKAFNIFTSSIPPHKQEACDIYYDDFFHLTYTYRLDSNVVSKYFVVRDLAGNIIAPGLAPPWKANLSSVNDKIKSKIKGKTKAVAYLSYNCEPEKRMDLNRLKKTFLEYALKIDTYNCSRDCEDGICDVALPDEYYFYIIFEEYFADDYVTEKILHAYDNYVVPIVFGGANFSRFLPPRSYIDGRLVEPNDLFAKIRDSMNDVTLYEEYFKWRNLYSIERYQPLCDLCTTLNKLTLNLRPKKDFMRWWYGEEHVRRCLSPQKQNEAINSNATDITTSTNTRKTHR